MAKLFRHFGLGGGSKKGPSQGASGPDFVTKTAGGSAQELRLKSPTKYRSSAIVASSSPSSVHGGGTPEQAPLGGMPERHGELDVRRHSDASSVRSLRPKTSNTDWSPGHNIGGVSKPKDSRTAGVFSQKTTAGRVPEEEETSVSGRPVAGDDTEKVRTCCACENGGNEGRRLAPPERAASVSSLILPKRVNSCVDVCDSVLFN